MEVMKKLYIWGAGDLGKRISKHFHDNWEIIFVDTDKQSVNSHCNGKKIISVDVYLKKHSDKFILIAHLDENASIEVLQKNHIINYFNHCDFPGEFQEPYARDNLKKFIVNYLAARNDYILYGLNLYSIMIDDWLDKQYGIHPHILIQDNITTDFVNKVRHQYPGLKTIDDIRQLNNIKEICICSGDCEQLKSRHIFDKYHITDIYDCSDRIESYYNPTIEKFRNLYFGKRCFIVATGPSIKKEDLDLLLKNEEICFSMNHIFKVYEKTNWRPDYYVMTDWRAVSNNKELIDTWPEIKGKFVADTSEAFWKASHSENIYCFHQCFEYFYHRLPKFSDDFSKRSYTGLTVTYTCMQLAAYMGFKEIYLLGVDFSYGKQDQGKKYAHFYKEDTLKAKGYTTQVTLAYQSAKQYAESHGVKIYNATRGGKLEIFERVDFDSLF